MKLIAYGILVKRRNYNSSFFYLTKFLLYDIVYTYLRKEGIIMYQRVHRGDIFYMDLNDLKEGHVQRGIRPVVVIQNEVGNLYSPTTIIVPCTTKIKRLAIQPQMSIQFFDGRVVNNTILCEQIRTVMKDKLMKKIGHLNRSQMDNIDDKLKRSLQLF